MIKFLRDEAGAAGAEYALILAVAGVGITGALFGLGRSVSDSMTNAGVQIAAAAGPADQATPAASGGSQPSSGEGAGGGAGDSSQGGGQGAGGPPSGTPSGPPGSPPGKPDDPGSNGKGHKK